VEHRVGKRAAHAVKQRDGEMEDEEGMLLCFVTDEVWIVRQSSALERKRGFVLLCSDFRGFGKGGCLELNLREVGFINTWSWGAY
jgi:hypothetical protein